MNTRFLLILVFVVSPACPGVQAEDLRSLTHNPFNQPGLFVPENGSPGTEKRPAWYDSLNAVLVAGPDSLVNINGHVLEIGESYEGYRLIRVEEGEAVFRLGEREIIVRVGDDSDDDDE
ncbi:MAG: hypothetical protein AB8G18_08875 [Gammaproteobacteria bacterium]